MTVTIGRPRIQQDLSAEQLEYGRYLLDDFYTLGVRFFADGVTYAAARRLMFHYTVIKGTLYSRHTYETRWCYETWRQALDATFDPNWQGDGDPEMGWHRHPDTERRPDLASLSPDMAAYLKACRAEEQRRPWAVFNDGKTGEVSYAEPRRLLLI